MKEREGGGGGGGRVMPSTAGDAIRNDRPVSKGLSGSVLLSLVI